MVKNTKNNLDWSYEVPKIFHGDTTQMNASEEENSFLSTNFILNKHI